MLGVSDLVPERRREGCGPTTGHRPQSTFEELACYEQPVERCAFGQLEQHPGIRRHAGVPPWLRLQ
ncbi:hypothetical protein D3C74_379310 [compost metagenome]